MEAVGIEEFVKNNPLCWQTVVGVVLVVFVSEFINTHSVPSESIVSLVDEELPCFRLVTT
jgi:hypothetical protein